MNNSKIKYLIYLFLGIFLILIDFLSKNFFENKSFFEGNFLSFQFSKNYGSAFGIFSNFEIYNLIIIIFSFVVLFGGIFYLFKYKEILRSKLFSFFVVLGVSGIIGNLIDRIMFGYVRDFISVKYFSIFNFADIYLSLAFVLYLVYEFKKK